MTNSGRSCSIIAQSSRTRSWTDWLDDQRDAAHRPDRTATPRRCGVAAVARRQLIRLAGASLGLACTVGCGLFATRYGPSKVLRIGVLVSGGAVTESGPTQNNSHRGKWLAFSEALHTYGWVEGKNTTIEWRSWYQQEESLPRIVSELLGMQLTWWSATTPPARSPWSTRRHRCRSCSHRGRPARTRTGAEHRASGR